MDWLNSISQGKARRDQAGLDIGTITQITLGTAAAVILLCLVAITCIDVVGRYFLDAPLVGAFEMTEVMLAALVFTALPLTTERQEHIEVDLLGMLASPRANQMMTAFAGVFSAALLATFAWRLFAHAMQSAHDGATTNALLIPLAPFGYLAGTSALLSAFIAFLRGFIPPCANVEDEAPEKGANDV